MIEQSLAGIAGNAGTLFRRHSLPVGRERTGPEVRRPSGRHKPDPQPRKTTGPTKSPVEPFDISSFLHPKTFIYIFAFTVLSLFQINDTLAIKELSRQNEKLREQLRISNSISTAQELRASELRSIHTISGSAQSLGLSLSASPPVYIEP